MLIIKYLQYFQLYLASLKDFISIKKYVFLYLVFCNTLFVNVYAQTKNNETNYLIKYPNAKAICTQKTKILNLIYYPNNQQNPQKNNQKDSYKDSLVCKANYYTEILHLSSQSGNYANESVSFSQFHEISAIKAYTILPNQQRMYVKDFVTKSVLGNNIFFDDLKEKSFVFPAVSSGAKTVLEYEEIIKEPRLLGVYYFNSYLPVEKSEFIVKTSPEIKISYKIFGENQAKIHFKTYQKQHETVYQWTAENLPSLKNEENTAKNQDDEPHIVVYIEEIKAKITPKIPTENAPIHYLKNLDDLYHWYYNLSKNILLEDNTYIKNLADSLIKNSKITNKTDTEKATILYNWVQQSIRYIAFEDGLGGLVPRKPEEVCKKRYGDCKDMATLLFSLAKAAKIPAFLVWVGTRNIAYKYTDLPVPIVDNHLITAFWLNNQYIFADATADYLPFAMPSEFIQGKQALLGIDSNSYKLVEIPIINAEKNVHYDSLFLKIDSNKMSGNGKLCLSGYPITKAMKNYYAVNNLTKKSLVDKKNHAISVSNITKIDNNLLVTNFPIDKSKQVENKKINSQFSVLYDCEATKLLKFSGSDIFLNLHIDKKLMTEKIDTTRRQTAVSIDFPYTYIFEIVLEIPQHWQINFTPPNRKFEHDKFSFHVIYKHLGNKIIMRKEIIIQSISIEKADFLSWNIMMEELNKAYQETMSFYE